MLNIHRYLHVSPHEYVMPLAAYSTFKPGLHGTASLDISVMIHWQMCPPPPLPYLLTSCSFKLSSQRFCHLHFWREIPKSLSPSKHHIIMIKQFRSEVNYYPTHLLSHAVGFLQGELPRGSRHGTSWQWECRNKLTEYLGVSISLLGGGHACSGGSRAPRWARMPEATWLVSATVQPGAGGDLPAVLGAARLHLECCVQCRAPFLLRYRGRGAGPEKGSGCEGCGAQSCGDSWGNWDGSVWGEAQAFTLRTTPDRRLWVTTARR